MWSLILSSHCASPLLLVTLKSPSHILTYPNWQTLCTFTHTDTLSLSPSKTLEEQGSGKCCSMLKGIRKICKCSSWLLLVRIAAVAGGLQSDSFFLNGASSFFFSLLFLAVLLWLMWGREVGFQNPEYLLALAFFWHYTAVFAIIGGLFSQWGYDVVKTLFLL